MTQTTGTVHDGVLQLDQRLDLPDQTRVTVTVEPVAEDWRVRFREGLERLRRRIREDPIRAGVHFTREELYEGR